ncbi:hypothetical protein UPYG_G00245650 [Umbra pygmaea]|uniref:C-type lectin domain-containing protein n=1 Tax=Umbra pygmaea TaxID=75934 RepID=A0ABD0WGE7_UMBPY
MTDQINSEEDQIWFVCQEGTITVAMVTVLLLLTAVFALGESSDPGKHKPCPKGWFEYQSHCYLIDKTARTWLDAEHHCIYLGEDVESEHHSKKFVGHLASVHSYEESQYLQALVQTVTFPLWVGGSAREGRWFWSDGSKFDYKNWAKGKPENYDPARKSCIQMNYGGKHKPCPKGWFEYQSHCYLIDKTARTWLDAEHHCIYLGEDVESEHHSKKFVGHLASVHSYEESQYLQALVQTVTFPLWVGGSAREGRWFWSDGSKFDYKNWAKGKPENYDPARKSCIQMNYGDKHRWNDETCSKVFPSVCALRRV